MNGRLLEHNSTLVIAAAREGSIENKPPVEFILPSERHRKSLVSRFASFIDAATEELREANRQLEVLSKTDGLTGLSNRRTIEGMIRFACEHDTDKTPSLVMMDLDDFKQINDTFGHKEGDEALKRFAAMARRLCEETACGASMGRWGGEEFIVLMRNTDRETATDFGERLRNAFEEEKWAQADVRHTVSVGVTRIHQGESADAALTRVDQALYQAKRNGKNCVYVLE